VAVAALRARFQDLERGVDLHPFHFYDRLRDLHREVCLLDEVLPDEPPPYDHDNPVACFEPLLKEIERRVSPTPDITHHEPFVRSGDLFRLSPLPAEIAKAAECYLLVQKQNLGEAVSVSGLKMASPSRLQIVQQLVLTGVPLKHVPVPPFRHPFGPNIDFYRLVVGEEWDHALREHGLVLFAPPSLQETRFALFWRNA
jgi:type VI secretion system protein ImpJ